MLGRRQTSWRPCSLPHSCILRHSVCGVHARDSCSYESNSRVHELQIPPRGARWAPLAVGHPAALLSPPPPSSISQCSPAGWKLALVPTTAAGTQIPASASAPHLPAHAPLQPAALASPPGRLAASLLLCAFHRVASASELCNIITVTAQTSPVLYM